jgi:hypothetical protein
MSGTVLAYATGADLYGALALLAGSAIIGLAAVLGRRP